MLQCDSCSVCSERSDDSHFMSARQHKQAARNVNIQATVTMYSQRLQRSKAPWRCGWFVSTYDPQDGKHNSHYTASSNDSICVMTCTCRTRCWCSYAYNTLEQTVPQTSAAAGPSPSTSRKGRLHSHGFQYSRPSSCSFSALYLRSTSKHTSPMLDAASSCFAM